MKVLVIAPHPDDETLGCGGTLLRHREENDELHWAIVTRLQQTPGNEATMAQKSKELDKVAEAFGMRTVSKLGFSTTRLDVSPVSDVIDKIRSAVDAVKPEVVYLVHSGDVHTDHQIVFAATMSVLKAFYMKMLGVRRVLSYETLSSTDAAPQMQSRLFAPNTFFDITPYMERKIEILSLYQTEKQPEPLPRSSSAVRALGRYRGASIGVEYAEAFMLIREIH